MTEANEALNAQLSLMMEEKEKASREANEKRARAEAEQKAKAEKAKEAPAAEQNLENPFDYSIENNDGINPFEDQNDDPKNN